MIDRLINGLFTALLIWLMLAALVLLGIVTYYAFAAVLP